MGSEIPVEHPFPGEVRDLLPVIDRSSSQFLDPARDLRDTGEPFEAVTVPEYFRQRAETG